MKKQAQKPRPPKAASVAKIAMPALKKGEVWICGMVQPGGRVVHTILMPGESKDLKHQDAMAWAKKQGGDLPDRVEQAMLFRDHRKLFQQRAYWSNTTNAGFSGDAWGQGFHDGGQHYWSKGNELLARAVRRETI